MMKGNAGKTSPAIFTKGAVMLPRRAMVLAKPKPVCLWDTERPSGASMRGRGHPTTSHDLHPNSLPDNGGVELTRVEEDAVEGRGQATLPEDGQDGPDCPQVCGDEDRTAGTHFGVTGWSWVGLTVGDGKRRPQTPGFQANRP